MPVAPLLARIPDGEQLYKKGNKQKDIKVSVILIIFYH
jgi:hypothetical protein